MYDTVRNPLIDWEHADDISNDSWHNNHLTNQQLKEWQIYLTDKFKRKLTWHNRMVGSRE